MPLGSPVWPPGWGSPTYTVIGPFDGIASPAIAGLNYGTDQNMIRDPWPDSNVAPFTQGGPYGQIKNVMVDFAAPSTPDSRTFGYPSF